MARMSSLFRVGRSPFAGGIFRKTADSGVSRNLQKIFSEQIS